MSRREPIFNLPAVVIATVLLLGAIHLVRHWLPEAVDDRILTLFAFDPGRYIALPAYETDAEDGWWPALWGPVTYIFLHADMTHLVSNCATFAALSNVIARRLGNRRFLLFCLATAVLSALGELAIARFEPGPVIGISGVICALMGALSRFLFADERDRLKFASDADHPDPSVAGHQLTAADLPVVLRPTAPVLETLRRPKAIQFILGFAVMNLVLVFGGSVLLGGGGSIAWMVHIAGFVAGFALFPAMDPIGDLSHMRLEVSPQGVTGPDDPLN